MKSLSLVIEIVRVKAQAEAGPRVEAQKIDVRKPLLFIKALRSIPAS